MISATANWIAANANIKKKPVFLIEIEGYSRAFTSAPGLGTFDSLKQNTNPIIQYVSKITDAGGFTTFSSTTGPFGSAVPAGDLIFAFLRSSGTIPITVTDTAGNTYTQLYQTTTSGAVPVFTAWVATSIGTPAGTTVTWEDGGGHGDAEFYVIHVSSIYSGFTYAGAQGTTTISAHPTASITVAGTTFLVPTLASNVAYAMFAAILSPASGPNAAITLAFIQGGGVPDYWIHDGNQIYVFSVTERTGYDWIVGIDDISLTVSDLDGGADLSDFVFNVQDRGQAITADMASFIFEGKECTLKQGFGTIDGYSNRVVFDSTFPLVDYLTLFTGKVDSVASDNNNQEYRFTVPDIRKDLTKVIYQTADDGFPTDSNHRKTISANPLDILLDVLENQVGYSTSQIDVAGITNYRDKIFAGEKFAFSLDSPPAAKDFIENEILKPLGGYHWTDNLGIIRVKFFYPLAPASVATLDHTNLLNVPLAEQAPLVTQVTYRFDAATDGKFNAESVQNWNAGITKFGLFGEQVIESIGLRSAFQGYFMAQFIARLIFLRYGNKQLQIEGLGAAWSQCRLSPGDIISLTSSLVPDRTAGTIGLTAKAFEILDRSWSPLAGVVTFKVLEIDLSKFTQYLITPNAEADFTAATPTDQGKYLFLCDVNDQYSDSTPGNTLC